MVKETLSIAAACLLLAGCSPMGGASSGRFGGMKLWPGRLGSGSSRQSFIEAVENDPFPRADQAPQVNLQVAARR